MDVAIIILSSIQRACWRGLILRYVCEAAFLVLFKVVHLLLYVLQLGRHCRHFVLEIPNGWTPRPKWKN
jgi:hypothetical protein